ncbi:YaaC family protein [Methylobacterium sp. Gmos1]
MLLKSHTEVRTRDTARYAWAGLRKFHNTRFTFDKHVELLSVPAKYRKFAEKQAAHIRYSLLQAKEYAIAAHNATLATKPVLMYYCCMSLALAEILMKQGGESSLDKARLEHNHHGLSLQADEARIRKSEDFSEVASSLKAIPLIKGGGVRSGTFELWHRSARGMPTIGKHIKTQANGTILQHYSTLMQSSDAAYPKIERAGISLLDTISHVPGMANIITSYGVSSNFVRGRVEFNDNRVTKRSAISTIIHPEFAISVDDFMEKFKFKNPRIDGFNFHTGGQFGGGIFELLTDGIYYDDSISPDCVNINVDDVLFCKDNIINEFGYLYTSLHILGNFARYFPDLWIKSVENSEPLAIVSEHFLEIAEERLPLLCLSELSRSYHVCID